MTDDALTAAGVHSLTFVYTFPTRLTGTCGDCGTTVTLEHTGGIGGERQSWPCVVCGDRIRMGGSDYTEATP